MLPGTASILVRLVLLALLWLILKDERVDLEMKVYFSAAITCFAVQCNTTVFDVHVDLEFLAVLAENEL